MKKIFATDSNIELARSVASQSGLTLGKCEIKKFADQEISVRLKESVQGEEIFVMGSSFPPADNLLELLILIHTLKANGAKKANLIIPYFAYAKSDRIKPHGASMAAELMVRLFEEAGCDTITTINLHSNRVEGFFKIPLIHLDAIPLLAQHFDRKKIKDLAIASPDKGGMERARMFAKHFGINEIISAEKTRPDFDQVKILNISGEVKNKNVIIVDDMIQSGGTIVKMTRALEEKGAKDIYVAVVHIVSSVPNIPLIEKEKSIKEIIFTDTIPSAIFKLPPKFKRVSVSNLISSSIV